MPAFILFVFHKHLGQARGIVFLTVFVLFAALAFTFNRSTWAGMATSIVVVFFISTKEQRRNLSLLLCAIIVFCVISIPLLTMYFPKLGDLFHALYVRGTSLFTADGRSVAWHWRAMENEYALAKIRQYPLFGIGPGNDYRPRVRLGGDYNTGYMHNAYLFILLDLGVLGFIPFVWFSGLYLVRGYRLWHTIQDQALMSVALGFCLSYVTILIASTASPVFMAWFWTPVLGVMLGVNEVIYKLDGMEE